MSTDRKPGEEYPPDLRGRSPEATGSIREVGGTTLGPSRLYAEDRAAASVGGQRSAEFETLAAEMYARGLSTRDIAVLLADESSHSLMGHAAVSEITERLWAQAHLSPCARMIERP